MERNPQHENFVPSVCAYHRAVATNQKAAALIHARAAVESAPCDYEAARWAQTVRELEYSLLTNWQKLVMSVRGAF